MGHTALVLGDQLMRDNPALEGADRVLFVESLRGLSRLRTHRRRVHLVLVAMRRFAAELEAAGRDVTYLRGRGTLAEGLDEVDGEVVCARPTSVAAQRVLERRGVRVVETNQFLTTPPQFEAWAREQRGGRLVMEPFYRWQRERFGVLMRERGGPEGGKWNLDHLNRRPPTHETHRAPQPWTATEDAVDDAVRADLDALDLTWWGEDAPRTWPSSPDEAHASLEHFCATRLAGFGPWQDAMVDGHPTLFHSLLSAPMNLGFLRPLDVVRRVEAEYRAGRVPLQSAEGFVRQVIGWREYMWGNYWLRRDEWPERNELDATLELPAAFGATPPARTGWRCLDSTVQKVWDDAYALGTEMLTKPYAGGGNYVNRMSEHCPSCRYSPNVRHGPEACPVTALYWDFMARNAERFDGNRRMRGPMAGLRRMPPEELAALRERAARAREELQGRG